MLQDLKKGRPCADTISGVVCERGKSRYPRPVSDRIAEIAREIRDRKRSPGKNHLQDFRI